MLAKRIFDIVVSLLFIVLLIPVFFVIMIAIKMNSKGGIFFLQRRLTKGMKEFTIIKFRTMSPTYDKNSEGIQVRGNSNAITKVGRFLRRSKLDEIPQLFNILIGDMSFVGPRPELSRRLKYYSDRDKTIFNLRSGISSPASIVFSDEEYLMNQVNDPEEFYLKYIMPYKIDLNIYYMENRTFLYDIYIMLVTLLKIFKSVPDSVIVKDRSLLARKDIILDNVKRD